MAITVDNIQNINMTDTTFRIKIYYEHLIEDFGLSRLIPTTVLNVIKNNKYKYYDELDKEVQYIIALYKFRQLEIVRIDPSGVEYIYFNTFNDPNLIGNPPEELTNVGDDELIDYFIRYNHTTEYLFVMVTISDGEIAIKKPYVFMDSLPNDLSLFQYDYEIFTVYTIKNFIQTFNSYIPFQPQFGTGIKDYLQNLDKIQVSELLKYEIDELISELKDYAESHGISVDINDPQIDVIESATNSEITYQISVIVNNNLYQYSIV